MGTPPWPAAGDDPVVAPGTQDGWRQAWGFDLVAPDQGVAVAVRLVDRPGDGAVSYAAVVVGPDRPPVVVVDHELARPRRPGSLELRGQGLWADHNREEPLRRWSGGLEAFGVAFDDPADVLDHGRGERVPVAFDLEWEGDGRAWRRPAGDDGYEAPARAHGELLLADEALEVDGVPGWWCRGWGAVGRPALGWAVRLVAADGEAWCAAAGRARTGAVVSRPGHDARPASAELLPVAAGAGGAELRVDGTPLPLEAWAWVALPGPGAAAPTWLAAVDAVLPSGARATGWLEAGGWWSWR